MNNLKEKFESNEWAMIQALLTVPQVKDMTWYDIAVLFNIKPKGDYNQRRKASNDIWRKYNRLISKLECCEGKCDNTCKEKNLENLYTPVSKKSTPKRLFFDIETSYNIVKSWRIGYNLNVNHDDIIQERAIITVAYKWEGDDNVYIFTWDKGDDKKLVKQFVKVLNEADEIIGHNIDKYDMKFIASRALKHGVPMLAKYKTTDTLKLARKHFGLNSNKLDYIAQFLGIGTKLKHRGIEMWDDIILKNDEKALDEMLEYNVQDVRLTEDVFNKLKNYTEPSIHHGVIAGKGKHSCPECGEVDNIVLKKTYVSKAGVKTRLMECACGTQFKLSDTNYRAYYEK